MFDFFTLTFWGSFLILAYTFAGYALLMRRLAGSGQVQKEPLDPQKFRVTAVVVACNEQDRIVARVRNLLASQYPANLLDVIVVSDGSTDGTVSRLKALEEPRLRVLQQPESAGKAAGLNAALEKVRSEIVVLTDARQEFAPDTIQRLVSHFSDSKVGAVSGELEIAKADSAIGSGVDAYWRQERLLRAAEARLDSCIGCTGAVYAIRRSLFIPIPPDTVLDDVVIPMQIAHQGFRVLHDPSAVAYDPQKLEPEAESRRKRRTLAGNFQMIFRYPRWSLPGNRLWWQFLSHKTLRVLAPLFLVVLFVSNALLVRHPFYALAFAGHCAVYGAAALSVFLPKWKPASLPAAFVFLNIQTVRAFAYYLTNRNAHRWR